MFRKQYTVVFIKNSIRCTRQGAFEVPYAEDLRRSAWSFKNHNIIYNKSWRTIMNLRRELYTECTLVHTGTVHLLFILE